MSSPSDRLARAKARPLSVENAIRTALRDAIAWRIGGGNAPRTDAFVAAAIAAARQTVDADGADAAECSRTLRAVAHAARRLCSSALYRRLMSVPASRLLRIARSSNGPDVVVRDRRGRLHAIALALRCDPFDAAASATKLARSTPLRSADRLSTLTVHLYSLATGQRHTFTREADGSPAPVVTRVA